MRSIGTEKRLDVGRRDAEIIWIQVVLRHETARNLPDVAVTRGGQLVDAVIATVDERRGAPRLEYADHKWNAIKARDSDR